MKYPAAEEIESKGLEVKAAPASQDASDSLKTYDVDAGASAFMGYGVV